jgi:IS5 family transposase
MISHESLQLTFHSEIYDKCVPSNHPYRRMRECLNMRELSRGIEKKYSDVGAMVYPVESAIKMMILEFAEDLSDRKMQRAMQENMAFRWFCGFSPEEDTPDYSYLSKLRKRIGTKGAASLFNTLGAMLKEKEYMSETFTFMDASSVISKVHLWKERDRAIEKGEQTLNKDNGGKHGSDPDASFGAKSRKKYWFGYKRHVSVDMRHGFINKVNMTTAKVPDNGPDVVKSICPNRGWYLPTNFTTPMMSGMLYGRKGVRQE